MQTPGAIRKAAVRLSSRQGDGRRKAPGASKASPTGAGGSALLYRLTFLIAVGFTLALVFDLVRQPERGGVEVSYVNQNQGGE